MGSFVEDCRRLENEPQQVIGECKEFRQEIFTWLNETVEEAERGLRGTPDVKLRLMGKSDYDPTIKLIAYSIAIRHMKSDERPKIRVGGQLGEAIGDALRDRGFTEHPKGQYIPELETGLLSERQCVVTFYVLPNTIAEDMDIEECPYILRPLIEYMTGGDSVSKTSNIERFKGLINHEMSHAYISGKLGSNWRNEYKVKDSYKIDDENEIDLKIRSIDEAACQAISSIRYPAKSTYIEYYQKQLRHSMADLQFFKTCFMIYARRFDSKEEKISRIRERAVTAVKRIKKTQKRQSRKVDVTKLPLIKKYGITEAFLGEENKKLKKLRKVLKKLEEAEKKSFFSLALLNMLEYNWDNHMKKTITSEIENELDNTIEQFVSNQGKITKLIPEESQTEVYDPEKGEYGDIVDEHKFDDSLYEIRQGLQKLLTQTETNEEISRQEAERLKTAVEDVEEAIDIYKEENKLEQSKQSELQEEYEEDTKKIAKWIKQRVEKGEYTDPVRIASNLEVETEAILDDYRRMIEAGLEYNQKIMEKMKSLHGDEQGIREILKRHDIKDEEIEEMMTLTQHIYNLCQKSDTRLKDAEKSLQKAESQIQNA